jgi:hypothetical protein
MKAILFFACALGLILGANANCSAQVSLTARQDGSYMINGLKYQIYDFTVRNSGTEGITSLQAVVYYPNNIQVGQSWNWDKTTGYISNFGSPLLVEQTYSGSGFILIGDAIATLHNVNVACGHSTPSPTDAPTQAPPTTAPTTAPPTSDCMASYSLVKRIEGGSFIENGYQSQIWDLIFRNSGQKAITDIKITITPATNTIVNQNNKWNLVYDADAKTYDVQLNNALQLAGSAYSGAGFVIAHATGTTEGAPSIAIKDAKCSN